MFSTRRHNSRRYSTSFPLPPTYSSDVSGQVLQQIETFRVSPSGGSTRPLNYARTRANNTTDKQPPSIVFNEKTKLLNREWEKEFNVRRAMKETFELGISVRGKQRRAQEVKRTDIKSFHMLTHVRV
jgi:hypothetical protein